MSWRRTRLAVAASLLLAVPGLVSGAAPPTERDLRTIQDDWRRCLRWEDVALQERILHKEGNPRWLEILPQTLGWWRSLLLANRQIARNQREREIGYRRAEVLLEGIVGRGDRQEIEASRLRGELSDFGFRHENYRELGRLEIAGLRLLDQRVGGNPGVGWRQEVEKWKQQTQILLLAAARTYRHDDIVAASSFHLCETELALARTSRERGSAYARLLTRSTLLEQIERGFSKENTVTYREIRGALLGNLIAWQREKEPGKDSPVLRALLEKKRQLTAEQWRFATRLMSSPQRYFLTRAYRSFPTADLLHERIAVEVETARSTADVVTAWQRHLQACRVFEEVAKRRVVAGGHFTKREVSRRETVQVRLYRLGAELGLAHARNREAGRTVQFSAPAFRDLLRKRREARRELLERHLNDLLRALEVIQSDEVFRGWSSYDLEFSLWPAPADRLRMLTWHCEDLRYLEGVNRRDAEESTLAPFCLASAQRALAEASGQPQRREQFITEARSAVGRWQTQVGWTFGEYEDWLHEARLLLDLKRELARNDVEREAAYRTFQQNMAAALRRLRHEALFAPEEARSVVLVELFEGASVEAHLRQGQEAGMKARKEQVQNLLVRWRELVRKGEVQLESAVEREQRNQNGTLHLRDGDFWMLRSERLRIDLALATSVVEKRKLWSAYVKFTKENRHRHLTDGNVVGSYHARLLALPRAAAVLEVEARLQSTAKEELVKRCLALHKQQDALLAEPLFFDVSQAARTVETSLALLRAEQMLAESAAERQSSQDRHLATLRKLEKNCKDQYEAAGRLIHWSTLRLRSQRLAVEAEILELKSKLPR